MICDTRLLSGLGLEVIEACNGKEAVKLCFEHQPVLTLLDIQMPEMDGIQALKKLRELGCTKPIYALTANAMSHEIAQYLSLGFAGHLKKPIERDIFVATIAQHFTEVIAPDDDTNVDSTDFDHSDLVQSFVEHLSQDKQNITQGNHNNHDTLARAAHKIAGAAKMFGFAELSQSAIELENAIKKQQAEDIDDLTHCLLDEINLVQHKHKTKQVL